MNLYFGQSCGLSIESTLVRDPDRLLWVLAQTPRTRQFAKMQNEVMDAVARFDAIPFTVPCSNDSCERQVTRGSVYRGSLQCRWWCDTCDPLQSGAPPSKLVMIAGFREAACYANTFCNGRQADLKQLVRMLAKAKGLADRAGQREIESFFG